MEYSNKINELLCKMDLHDKKLLAAEQQKESLKLNDAKGQEMLDCLKARSKDEGNGEVSTVFSDSIVENLYAPRRIIKVSDCGECNEIGISKHSTVALANDHRVIIYSEIIKVEEVLCKWNDNDYLHCLAWNEEGTLLAVGGWKPSTFTIDIWDISKKSIIKQLKYEDNQDCFSIVWKGNIVSFATMSFIYHWNIYSQHASQESDDKINQITTSVHLCHHNDRINTMQWSPCKSKLALMTWKGGMYIYDEDMNLIHDVQAHSEIKSVLQWCPWDNQVMATGCDHGFLRLWRLENTVSIIKDVKIDSGIPNIMWIPSKNAIVSSYYNNQLILWEYPSLNRITVLNIHTSTPRNLALTRDKNLVSRSSREMIFWKPFD